MRLVLGSASPYKKQLIAQLGIPFEKADPNYVDTKNPLDKGGSIAIEEVEALGDYWIVAPVSTSAAAVGSIARKRSAKLLTSSS